MQVLVPRGHNDQPVHRNRVPSRASAGAALADRRAGGEEAHVSPVSRGDVRGRVARAESCARGLPSARARHRHAVLLRVPGAAGAAHAVLLGVRRALRPAARHRPARPQRRARAHCAPLEPRELAAARPPAVAAMPHEQHVHTVEEWRQRELESAPDAEAREAAAQGRGEGGAQRHVRLAVHVALPLAQRSLARHCPQCAPPRHSSPLRCSTTAICRCLPSTPKAQLSGHFCFHVLFEMCPTKIHQICRRQSLSASRATTPQVPKGQ